MPDFLNILAIDFGTKRIGLAVASGPLAEPLEILENTPQVFTQLKKIIADRQIEEIVIGISEQEMAQKTKDFIAELEKNTSLPIKMVDETLSSVTVHEKLAERNQGKKQHIGPIDHYAAAEILQAYLDEQ